MGKGWCIRFKEDKNLKQLIFDFLKGTVVLGALAVILLWAVVLTGCPEAEQMVGPVVTDGEPMDTDPPTVVAAGDEPEPVVNGEVKEPEEPVVDEPAEPAEEPVVVEEPEPEPTPPADTTPPAVTAVEWYRDWQLTEAMVNDVRPGDTIYTIVAFSEPMLYTVADDGTARPALSIVIGGVAARYRILAHGTDGNAFASGTAKPFHDGTNDFLCRYTVPVDAVGTIALRVEAETADLAGNTVSDTSEHIAMFMVLAEPTPEDRYRAKYEQYGFSEEVLDRLVQREIEYQQIHDAYDRGEISSEESVIRYVASSEKAFGISSRYIRMLRDVYMEERPEERIIIVNGQKKLAGTSAEKIGIAWLIVKEANPDATEEELEELFREAAREGTISII